jgi:hypothetical protein
MILRKLGFSIVGFFVVGVIFGIFGVVSVNAAGESTVCCEKTTKGLFCQDSAPSECALNFKQAPTSCDTTSFCEPGICFDSGEGTCLDNTPQKVCNDNGGKWSKDFPSQCDLGCCVLGDQAAFVTLTRCKALSSQFGLETNYNTGIQDEVQCILSVQNQDKGACVYNIPKEGVNTCKFTTRSECSGIGGAGTIGEFFVDRLCTDENLNTNCAKTDDTICVPGKDEVYFVDTCGNPGNVYDAGKVGDLNYWSEISEAKCSIDANGNKNCGNCNYLDGSFCRAWDKDLGGRPSYGENICADLNCEDSSAGFKRHGESWCVYDDKGGKDNSNNAVGSRFYKHICINGEEVLEQCAEFRQEECIEDKIDVGNGEDFSQAACRVNRWQDCTAQGEERDCENSDRRDCSWQEGINFGGNSSLGGICLPKNSPGLKFWEGEESRQICGQGNDACIVTYTKKLTGDWKCEKNCECLEQGWEDDHKLVCTSLGDCGPKINWIGSKGFDEGFEIERGKA